MYWETTKRRMIWAIIKIGFQRLGQALVNNDNRKLLNPTYDDASKLWIELGILYVIQATANITDEVIGAKNYQTKTRSDPFGKREWTKTSTHYIRSQWNQNMA